MPTVCQPACELRKLKLSLSAAFPKGGATPSRYRIRRYNSACKGEVQLSNAQERCNSLLGRCNSNSRILPLPMRDATLLRSRLRQRCPHFPMRDANSVDATTARWAFFRALARSRCPCRSTCLCCSSDSCFLVGTRLKKPVFRNNSRTLFG